MNVYFKDEANDTVLNQFDTELKNAKFVKSYDFITKDEAAKNNVDIVGKDFKEFLGFNPLQNSFDIHLKGDYVTSEEIKKIEMQFKRNTYISDVIYPKELVDLVNENVEKISFWILIISGVLTVIAMLLINGSIRLSIYSHRFTIKTMQMVGATKSFIRKPFIIRNILLGLAGSVLAIISLLVAWLYVDSLFPTLGIAKDVVSFVSIALGVILVGVLITFISTFFATTRFLNLRTDDLY
jgi:cell division transport system permease protein